MPFGLSNAPVVFQELSVVLHGAGLFAVAYLNDIVIFNEALNDYL